MAYTNRLAKTPQELRAGLFVLQWRKERLCAAEPAAVSFMISLIVFVFLPGANDSNTVVSLVIRHAAEFGFPIALATALSLGMVVSVVPAMATFIFAKLAPCQSRLRRCLSTAASYSLAVSLGVLWPLWIY